MNRERHSREWWAATVARWRRSGAGAREFAERAGLNESTLRWWSAQTGRDTRAEHGRETVPIEIAVPARHESATAAVRIELVAEGVILRVGVGSDVAYVAAIVRALRA